MKVTSPTAALPETPQRQPTATGAIRGPCGLLVLKYTSSIKSVFCLQREKAVAEIRMDVDAMTNGLCIRVNQQVGKDGLDDLICKTKIETRGREPTYGHQAGKEGGMNWEVGIDISTPLIVCMKQVPNENLLCSTRALLCSVMTEMGRKSIKRGKYRASLVAQMVKSLPTMRETQVLSLGRGDPLEKAMAPHSSVLAWKIPWTEEPGRLQSVGSQRVRHN